MCWKLFSGKHIDSSLVNSPIGDIRIKGSDIQCLHERVDEATEFWVICLADDLAAGALGSRQRCVCEYPIEIEGVGLGELKVGAADKREVSEVATGGFDHRFDGGLVVSRAGIEKFEWALRIVEVGMEVSDEDCHVKAGVDEIDEFPDCCEMADMHLSGGGIPDIDSWCLVLVNNGGEFLFLDDFLGMSGDEIDAFSRLHGRASVRWPINCVGMAAISAVRPMRGEAFVSVCSPSIWRGNMFTERLLSDEKHIFLGGLRSSPRGASVVMNEAPPTILIVDDEPALADGHAALLDDYDVRTAYSGREGLETLDSDVDIVLLDRRMPGLSGEEVLDRIRNRGVNCRVIMLTGVEPSVDIVEMRFDEYLTKPVSREELRRTVDRIHRRAKYDAKLQEYFALASKRATLETQQPREELTRQPEYTFLCEQLDAIRRELDEVLKGLPDEDGYLVATTEPTELPAKGGTS